MTKKIWWVSLAITALAGCSTASTTCVTGMTIACACPGGAVGVQRCNASGAFDGCECGGADGGPGDDGGPQSDGGPGSDSGPGNDSGPGVDAGPMCSAAADCSDGVYCNGPEECAPTMPGVDGRGCRPGPAPCAMAHCDESGMRCSACDGDFDGHMAIGCGGDDCNDDDANVHPGVSERCDGIDSDCSSGGGTTYDEDADHDMHAATSATCMGGPWAKDDCNDHDARMHPGAMETCDGLDDDCNGMTDEFPAGAECGTGTHCFLGACMPIAAGHVTDVSAGGAFTCAMRSSGDVYCWGGQATYGNLGDGGADMRPMAGPPVAGLSDAMAISTGGNHACALRAGGTLVCWGYDSWGQVGDGMTSLAQSTPRAVVGVTGVTAVGAAGASTCALLGDHSVLCWGLGRDGQIGDGSFAETQTTPTPVSGLSGALSLAPAHDGNTYCARVSGGHMQCWGDNGSWQLGGGAGPSSATPVTLPGIADEVDGAAQGFCARRGGQVLCWGYVPGTTGGTAAPTAIAGITDAVEIAVGDRHACVRHTAGTVSCFGDNDYGQLGIGYLGGPAAPAPLGPVGGLSDAVALTANGHHTCALRATGDVVCWGWNMFGQLGDGTMINRSSPVTVIGIPH